MKFFLFLLLVLVAAPHLTAQSTGIDQSSNLIAVPAGDKFLRWHGHAGRSYFVQVSDANKPLGKWSWAPIIESGHDEEISYEVDGSSSRGFFRLLHTNLQRPPGVSLEDWDPDGDRLRNRAELTTHGSNPLKRDTDDDGLPDDWEIAHGLNVLDNGTADPDRGPDSPFGTQPSMPQGSAMMAAAMASVACTMSGGRMFGRICRSAIRQWRMMPIRYRPQSIGGKRPSLFTLPYLSPAGLLRPIPFHAA